MFRSRVNTQQRGYRNQMHGRGFGLFHGIGRTIKNFAYNTMDLLHADDGFYEDERRFSAAVLNQRQFYNERFMPPVSPYANSKEAKHQYRQFIKENEIYIPAPDEEVDTKPSRKGGLSKKLALKAKQKAGGVADISKRVAKGTASATANIVKAGAGGTAQLIEDIPKTKAAWDARKDKKNQKNQTTPDVQSFDDELVSLTKPSDITPTGKQDEVVGFDEPIKQRTKLDIKGAFHDGFVSEEISEFDLELDEMESEEFVEINLKNKQCQLSYDTWMKAIIDKPVYIDLDELRIVSKIYTAADLKGKKPMSEKEEMKHLINDAILFIPSKGKYVVVTDKKKDAFFRNVQIRLSYDGHEDTEYRKYTCSDLYIHATGKMPVIVYFRIDSEEL